jgi:hypothetical protein
MTWASVSVTWRLDAAGEWEGVMPLTDPQAATLRVGDIVHIYREGEGIVLSGLIEQLEHDPTNGTLKASGLTLLGELLRLTTGRFRRYDDDTVNAIVDDLLADTGWTRQGSISRVISTWFHGDSLLEALVRVVRDRGGGHFRERYRRVAVPEPVRDLEIGTFGEVRCILTGGNADVSIIDSPSLGYVESLQVIEDRRDVWNWLIVLGAGDGEAQLTIEPQTYLPNLLSNWNFEQTGGWTAYGGATISYVATRYVYGTRSLRTRGGATAGGVRQSVNVTAGKTYRCKVWVWPASAATLRLSWLNAAGGVISSITDTVTSQNRWAPLQVEGQAPTGAVTARVELEVPAAGDAWWDVCRLWETAASKGLPLEIDYRPSRLVTDTPHLNWALVDQASVAQWGRRERVLAFKDVAPLSNTTAALQVAANVLYDLATVQARRWRQPITAYKLTARNVPTSLLPGDKVRLRFRGLAQTLRGTYSYLDIDAELWVLQIKRTFEASGADSWELTVSTADLPLGQSDADVVARVAELSKTWAVSVQASVSVWTETLALQTPVGPAAGEELNTELVVPDNCLRLLRCRLKLAPRAIRSTAKGAAAGGGATSSVATDHSHSLQGVTSEASGVHSHSLSGTTTDAGGGGATTSAAGAHRHYLAGLGGAGVAWTDPQYIAQLTFYDPSNNSYPVLVGTDSSSLAVVLWTGEDRPAAHTHNVDLPSHQHSFSTQTTQEGGSHSHSFGTTTTQAGGSHSHNIPAHTHDQVYGIFEGTNAQQLRLFIDNVDRTSELGGPWNAQASMDITRYLLDDQGLPVRGAHSIKVTTAQLGAVDLKVEWVAVVAPLTAG